MQYLLFANSFEIIAWCFFAHCFFHKIRLNKSDFVCNECPRWQSLTWRHARIPSKRKRAINLQPLQKFTPCHAWGILFHQKLDFNQTSELSLFCFLMLLILAFDLICFLIFTRKVTFTSGLTFVRKGFKNLYSTELWNRLVYVYIRVYFMKVLHRVTHSYRAFGFLMATG